MVKQASTGESITRNILAQDLDKNGSLNLDGLKAALLVIEFGFRSEDVEEIFLYISDNYG